MLMRTRRNFKLGVPERLRPTRRVGGHLCTPGGLPAFGRRAVATPVSSNTALELAGFATDIRRTRIASPYVVTAMQEAVAARHAPVAGFEANGGFLLATAVTRQGRRLAALPTRDAVLPMLCALVAAHEADLPLSALVGTLPARDLFGALCGEPAGIDFTDGVRILGVQSLAGAKARLAEALRGKAQRPVARIDFATPELLWRILSPNRLQILRAMSGAGPLALREIARRVGRDVKGVHSDVHALLLASVLDRIDEGFVFPFDAIHVDFTIQAAA